MEAFFRMMTKLVSNGVFAGFKVDGVSSEEICISHLLFVDDTLILCGAEGNHFRSIRWLLLCFEVFFRLKVNLSKLEVIPIGSVGNV